MARGLGGCAAGSGPRAIVERTMWTFRVIVFAPAFQLLPDIGEREENRHVQAFIAEPPIE